jgi:hypothetical protein
MNYYRIKGMPGFDGLIAGVDGKDYDNDLPVLESDDGPFDLVPIAEIINPNVAIGDSTLKWPQEFGAMFINNQNLEWIDYSPREFSTGNPFGKLVYEGHYSRDNISVDYASYESGTTVTISEPGVTLFSQNFYGTLAARAENEVKEAISGDFDLDDLIFRLKELI